MELKLVGSWMMLLLGGASVIVAWKIAMQRPNQWKALLVLTSFALVCLGALPASQWFASLPWFKNPESSSPARHAKTSANAKELVRTDD
jgi:hypothetical protein